MVSFSVCFNVICCTVQSEVCVLCKKFTAFFKSLLCRFVLCSLMRLPSEIGVYSLWSRAESLFLDASETPQSWSRMSAISSSSRVAAGTQQLYVKISHTHTQIWGRGLICHFVGGANKEVIGVNIAHCHFSCRLSA